MATANKNPPIIVRVLATCVAAAKKSGEIIRDIVFEHDANEHLTQVCVTKENVTII